MRAEILSMYDFSKAAELVEKSIKAEIESSAVPEEGEVKVATEQTKEVLLENIPQIPA
eukprot:CAMPEP_0201285450 /NCGR_PEP_ID=MMETSP1317-20130820/108224_1 /ASSEMBLY_ACC=CAM_ASM_000770 /TAXON_ID=187299 /ORGANISM="Undescribed Undescribed, Strain Undescribed" /LENGTH=57 /DNA_ID=CAMNT_0047610375 /DNA_START=156 /DNA_END=325 /DNA_ORIENTATION=+